jgi:hypothetical protein
MCAEIQRASSQRQEPLLEAFAGHHEVSADQVKAEELEKRILDVVKTRSPRYPSSVQDSHDLVTAVWSRSVTNAAVTEQDVRHPVGRPLMMSLRPRFAQAILDGSKTVELRRTRVLAPPGTTIIIYASAPVISVVGIVTLGTVDADNPNTLGRRHRKKLGVTEPRTSTSQEWSSAAR